MPRFLALSIALLLVAQLLSAGLPAPAAAQDFDVLRDRRPFVPDVKPGAVPLNVDEAAPRVLIAGDSWAQYMWDDGSHNDVFDKFGHQDKQALSQSLDSDPGPGYTGSAYAVSGSEARQWVDTADYPYIANMTAALQANPTIDLVMLSIGGNDVLAGKSDGGWYKDMDLDVAGSEAALFAQIEDDTFTIIDAALAVRPGIRVMLASYDYPNFNVGFWCFLYACPKREDLSRDPDNDLITDQELNGMMVIVEGQRIDWTNAGPRVLFDHAVGLMHHYYGDGQSGPGVLPHPGQTPPDYTPFPGGNPARPTLRSNFRNPGVDADPIHLDYEGYQYKITNQTQTTFFPEFRGTLSESFFSEGAGSDGWTNGTLTATGAVRAGRDTTGPVAGILSFDTSSIPDGATITAASVYLHRKGAAGTSPFLSGSLGMPRVDVAGSFGAPGVEASDLTAPADADDAADVWGSARANGYAVRLELLPAGLAAIDDQGTTQLRLWFPAATAGTANHVDLETGDAGSPVDYGLPTLGEYMGTSAPFLDVTYEYVSGIADGAPGAQLLRNSPNPFGASTTIPFALAAAGRATVRVFDVAGGLVAVLQDGPLPAGNHSVVWDGREATGRRVAPGVYFARLTTAETTATVRMTLAR